jgi:hypothetical protein
MSNTITFTLNAKDEATKVVKDLVGTVKGELAGAFGQAMVAANLFTAAIQTGLGKVNDLVGRLREGLNQAIDIQSENISTAGNIMKLTGQNYDQASDFIDKFSIKMSNVAATLPGATSDYVNFGKAIMDDVIPAFKNLDGSIDLSAMRKELEEVSTYGTLLQQSAGVTTQSATNAISKFLGGTSGMASLRALDFFEKNTTFRNILTEEIEKLGGDVQALTVKQRLEIFKKAAQLPPEVLKAQSESIGGLMAGFESLLFDPQSGIFGFMRDLNEKATGSQSVLVALNELLAVTVGEGGLFFSMGETLKNLGVDLGDPMVALRSGILFITNKLQELNSILKDFNFNGNVNLLRERVGNFFKNLFNFDVTPLAKLSGEKLAQIVNGLFSEITKLDYGFIAGRLLNFVGAFFQGVGAFLANLDSGVYATVAAGILLSVGVIPAITTFAGGLFATFVAGTAGLPVLLVVAAGLAIGALAKTIIEHWDQISQMAGEYLGNIGKAVSSATDLFVNLRTNILTGNFEAIKKSAQDLIDALKKLFLDPLKTVQDFIDESSGNSTSYERQSEAMLAQKEQEFVNKIYRKVQSGEMSRKAAAEQLRSFGSTIELDKPGEYDEPENGFSGFNNSDLLSAIGREMANSPSGARPIIANSSETILNQSQANGLLSALRGGKSGVSIGNIVINATSSDPRELANQVIKEIEYRLSVYSQGMGSAMV